MATMQVKRVFKATPNIYSSLKNFLPAGTIAFNIDSPLNSFTGDNDLIAEDAWRSFPQVVVGFRDETGGIDSISFLVRHRFIAATYSFDTAHRRLLVRVYVIPWDLAGSRGELRERDENVVLKGSKSLKQLFLRINTDPSLWEGRSASSSSPGYFISPNPDNRSLLDIYNALPSPSATPTKGRIPGLRTNLYNYQRRSVATMIARETNPGTIEHPLYVPMKGLDGRVFYMQPATMEILSELPRVSAVRGGILCEELGTGKTIMILSLILGTLNQLAAPEEGIHEERVPLTNVAFRRFQTAPVISERAKFSGRKKRKEPIDAGFPSLAEIILHKIRVAPEGIPWREPEEQERLERHRMWKPLMANVPFYLHTPDPPEAAYGRRARQQETSGPKVMYLSSATIVIVPDNLRRQWANEILKHCTDLLRVLLVEDNRELPEAPVLATYYDVILMSQSRFSQEAKKKNVENLHSWNICDCKLLRRCKCSRRKDVSPLLQIRWKRLVVDEGHNTAEKRTEYAIFSNLMSVERRWIVTGTPTTNLLGLSFGAGSELMYPEDEEEAMQIEPQRLWHGDERDDLRKLGHMLSHFLLMMPFASKSEPKAFTNLVANPLFAPSGPYPGDIDVLVQVMASVMVRHRIEDVESEVTLALLDHKTVLLDLDPMAVKTYNLIQATIAVNAVDSERMHQDYLFHPRNTSHLQALVANISNVMFWHVVDSGLDERLTNSQLALENLNKRNGTPEDFELIQQSIYHVRSAMDDPVWLALQNQYNIFRRVDNMHPSIYSTWCGFAELAQKTSPVMLLSPTALTELRKSVTQRPLSSIHQISENGRMYVEKEHAYREYLRLQDRKKKSTREKVPESDRQTRSYESEVRKKAQEKKDEMKREMDVALARLNAAFSGEETTSGTPPKDAASRTVQSAMLRLSPVANVRIRNSTSTKLDYILHEVLTYGAEDKFLIFSESAATLSFIAETFDLCRIKYLSFSGQHDREERQSMITTFETSDLYRVLLLELKYGARGLNLVSASRVIFCEPVWKADVESQAIKRVHRIGQTRTVVHVTTLAIKSTFEEVMVARSKALRENKQEFAKAATDDRTIRDFIEHPVFLPVPTEARLVDIDVPLFDLPSPPSAAPQRPQPVIEITSGPPRKRLKVSFAD
ncbi:P-loop containing nucleoside triphosphate hydrolase protein [Trametes gibbosa]|nr:P-loop containing nucleoside triphosphate hydrolase protein [Trametes gibbosa]